MSSTDSTTAQTTTDARTAILDALTASGMSAEDAARTLKSVGAKSPQRNSQAAQQVAADQMSRITDKQLKDAGVTRDDYVTGARQLLGYASHAITIPEMFGPRYDSTGTIALWGRPRPVKKSGTTETTDSTETV